MRIDLRSSGRMNRELAILLDEIALELRRPFVEFTTELSTHFGDNIDWWITPIACRNTYSDDFFLKLCQLRLIHRLVSQSENISEVIVDNPNIASLLISSFPQQFRVICSTSRRYFIFKRGIIVFYKFLLAVYSCLARFSFSKLVPRSRRADIPSAPISFIETIIYPESIQRGVFKDRHYPGLLECLNDNEAKLIYWAPYYYGVKNYFRLFLDIRSCRDNFLIAEDYLTWRDYLFALLHIIRGSQLKFSSCFFMGMDVTALVFESHLSGLANGGSIEALLRYRFIYRLREAGILLSHAVDWFENQEVDHGAILALRTFYPDIFITGYQGFFASPVYLCMFPIKIEQEFNFLPHKVSVVSPCLISAVKEFNSDLRVLTAPAFRFYKEFSVVKSKNQRLVLFVPLPAMGRDVEIILSLMVEFFSRFPSWRARCLVQVKFHPSFSEKSICRMISLVGFSFFEIVNDDFENLLCNADILVGAASSSCVEAIVRGVAVIIVGSRGAITQNPLPSVLASCLWSVCYSFEDVARFIESYLILRSKKETCYNAEFMSNFFCETSSEAVRKFIKIDSIIHDE